jgi:K+-sensing histidine kinase KdpD
VAARERPWLPLAVRWTVAIACPLGALVANQAIPNGLFPTPFLLTAVMITAHFGGMRAAALAFVLSFGLLDYFYVPPFGSLAVDEDTVAALAQFIVPAALGVWFIHKRKEIAVTARARAEDRHRCIAAGMDGFIAKPIDAAELWGAIDRFAAAAKRLASS